MGKSFLHKSQQASCPVIRVVEINLHHWFAVHVFAIDWSHVIMPSNNEKVEAFIGEEMFQRFVVVFGTVGRNLETIRGVLEDDSVFFNVIHIETLFNMLQVALNRTDFLRKRNGNLPRVL